MITRQSFPSNLLVVLSIAYFGLAVVSISEPATLWGISHLYYFDWPIRIAVLVVCFLTAAIVVIAGNGAKVPTAPKTALLRYVLPLVLFGIFFFLRVKTHYLGDGIFRAREIELGIRFLPTELLGHYTSYLCHTILSALFGWSAIQSMAALSMIAGIAFYFAVLDLTRTLFQGEKKRAVVFVILYFSGTALLFCGYAESYSLLPALITFFVASGVRAVEDRGSVNALVSLYLVLVFFHLQFLYLAPSLLFVAYRQFRQGATWLAVRCVIALLASVAAAIFLPMLADRPTHGVGGLLIELVPNDSYWLFSGQHLADVVNQLLLTAVAPITLIMALSFSMKGRQVLIQPRLAFVGMMLPGALAILTLLQPQLGYASDWDLFSSVGVVVGAFALILYSLRQDVVLSRFANVMITMVAMFSFLSFAAVNADAEKALTRQVDILNIADKYGAIGFETLGTDMNKSGRDDLAEQMWKRSAEIAPHARVLGNLGQLALGQKRYAEAESYLMQSLALDSTRAMFTLYLGLAYVWQGRSDLGERYLRKAVEMAPDDAKCNQSLANFLSQFGKVAEAESYSRRAVALEPRNASFATTLGTILSRKGNYADAKEVLLQVIQMQPEFADAYVSLAAVYRSQGQPVAANQTLNDYLARFPTNSESAKIKQALNAVNQ